MEELQEFLKILRNKLDNKKVTNLPKLFLNFRQHSYSEKWKLNHKISFYNTFLSNLLKKFNEKIQILSSLFY